MNILIIGGGFLGRKTAEMLDEAGHTVCLLDENAENLALLSREFGGVTSCGFPMDVKCLRSAGIEGCDAVAVTTADDNLNIAVGEMAKKYFGVAKVMVRISDPRRETVFQDFGLETFCPTNTVGETLVTALTNPVLSRQVTFGTSTVSLFVQPVDRRYHGRTTADLEIRPGDGVLGVIREGGALQVLEPGGELELKPGDFAVYARRID